MPMRDELFFDDTLLIGDISTPNSELHIVGNPQYESRLHIVEGFTIDFLHKKPNAWRRFWQWVFLDRKCYKRD